MASVGMGRIMIQHIRANLWLLVLTLLICSALYPLILWGIGQAVFPEQSNGSIITDKDGQPVGSRLIGQPFTRDEYFQPRPSSAGSGNGYNAAASGASNWAASQPLLRARVAQQLGPIVTYGGKSPKHGQKVGPDIETWFRQWPKEEGGVVARWADTYSSAAQAWVKSDDDHKAHVKEWQEAHPAAVVAFKEAHRDIPDPAPEDMAVEFFKSYAAEHPGTWPTFAAPEGQTKKVWQDIKEGSDIQSFFFDMWLQDPKNAGVDLEPVPADMVMASGSGLDPHITLKNAEWQLENRVAEAWARKLKGDPDKAAAADKERVQREVQQATVRIREEVKQLLHDKASAPFGGLFGEKLINVLEVNLALRDKYEPRSVAAK
jgi:K+-transporting ATPase ATPase C chain